MKETFFFYRAGQHCLLAQNTRNNDWHGFVGFLKEHPYHGCNYKKIKNIAIFKIPVNRSLDTVSEIRKNLWYMGFITHPYSREKTLEDLKKLADDIYEELKKED